MDRIAKREQRIAEARDAIAEARQGQRDAAADIAKLAVTHRKGLITLAVMVVAALLVAGCAPEEPAPVAQVETDPDPARPEEASVCQEWRYVVLAADSDDLEGFDQHVDWMLRMAERDNVLQEEVAAFQEASSSPELEGLTEASMALTGACQDTYAQGF